MKRHQEEKVNRKPLFQPLNSPLQLRTLMELTGPIKSIFPRIFYTQRHWVCFGSNKIFHDLTMDDAVVSEFMSLSFCFSLKDFPLEKNGPSLKCVFLIISTVAAGRCLLCLKKNVSRLLLARFVSPRRQLFWLSSSSFTFACQAPCPTPSLRLPCGRLEGALWMPCGCIVGALCLSISCLRKDRLVAALWLPCGCFVPVHCLP